MQIWGLDLILRTWNSCIEPHRAITKFEDKNGAKLFATIMIVHVIVVAIVINVINLVSIHYLNRAIWEDRDSWVVLAGVAIIVLAYLVLRSGRYRLGVGIYIAISAIVPLTSPFVNDPNA